MTSNLTLTPVEYILHVERQECLCCGKEEKFSRLMLVYLDSKQTRRLQPAAQIIYSHLPIGISNLRRKTTPVCSRCCIEKEGARYNKLSPTAHNQHFREELKKKLEPVDPDFDF